MSKKQRGSPRLNLRISEEMHSWLKDHASRQGKGMSAIIKEYLESLRRKEETMMKTIPIHLTKKEYNWLSHQAAQQRMTVAKIIEGMVREAYLSQGEELPPYDWGEEGIPSGDPIEYDPELGFVVIEKEEE